MLDLAWVDERIATGACVTSPQDLDAMVAAGVTHLIDCRCEDYPDRHEISLRFRDRYVWVPAADDGMPKPVEWFAAGVGFGLAALRSHPDTKVASVCVGGCNRGPSMAYCLLRSFRQLPPDEADDRIRRARPIANIAYSVDADDALRFLGWA